MKVNAKEKAPKACRTCGNRKEAKEKIRISNLLEKAIKSFEKRIEAEDFKPTIAEYLKLLQLEQESEQETEKEIKVTWIDPTVTPNTEE
jgi:DNA-directed RNA polymerase subunit M/transcription elongation factor TFIIS